MGADPVGYTGYAIEYKEEEALQKPEQPFCLLASYFKHHQR